MLFGFPSAYVWMVVLIATVAIEAFTLNLVSIWFGVGALAALVLTTLELPVTAQLIAFIVVAAALLVLVRPFTRKLLRIKDEKTNADRIIGQTAIVTVEINNALSQGEIKLMGQSWSARSADDTRIMIGNTVRVLAISGVRAVVEKV